MNNVCELTQCAGKAWEIKILSVLRRGPMSTTGTLFLPLSDQLGSRKGLFTTKSGKLTAGL